MDEIKRVLITGGKITADAEATLESRGIQVKSLPMAKVEAAQDRREREDEFRKLLEQQGTDIYQKARLGMACDLIVAKIQSNITYCLKLADTAIESFKESITETSFDPAEMRILWDKRLCQLERPHITSVHDQLCTVTQIRDVILQQIDHFILCHLLLKRQDEDREILRAALLAK